MIQKLLLLSFVAFTAVFAAHEKPEISIEILKEGTGELVPNMSNVKCHYVLNLEDGTKIDSSRDRGSPFEFQVGKGMVIQGWEQGIIRMRKGERSLITIPSELGYGSRGAGGRIPGGATLKFDVEILDFSN